MFCNFYKKIFGSIIRLKYDISYNIYTLSEIAVELRLPGLIGTASHPDVQKIRIIGSFLETGYIGTLKFGCYYLQYVPASKPFDHAVFGVLEAITLYST